LFKRGRRQNASDLGFTPVLAPNRIPADWGQRSDPCLRLPFGASSSKSNSLSLQNLDAICLLNHRTYGLWQKKRGGLQSKGDPNNRTPAVPDKNTEPGFNCVMVARDCLNRGSNCSIDLKVQKKTLVSTKMSFIGYALGCSLFARITQLCPAKVAVVDACGLHGRHLRRRRKHPLLLICNCCMFFKYLLIVHYSTLLALLRKGN